MISHIVIAALALAILVVSVRIARTVEDIRHDLRRKTDVKVDIKKDNE